MRMRQYICHTYHNLWDVIVNGDLEEEPAPTGETSAPPAPKTAKQLAARRNQERVKSILLLAIPDEYLLKCKNVEMLIHSWEENPNRGLVVLISSAIVSLKTREIALLLMKLVLPVEIYIGVIGSMLTAALSWMEIALGGICRRAHLLVNVDLEGAREKVLMVSLAGAIDTQLNLHHRAMWSRGSRGDTAFLRLVFRDSGEGKVCASERACRFTLKRELYWSIHDILTASPVSMRRIETSIRLSS
ncbi:hypothetical protein Tco_0053105 [Tanacetum coccineum]